VPDLTTTVLTLTLTGLSAAALGVATDVLALVALVASVLPGERLADKVQ
jgi:hypothetical protein